ncbi:outer envelope pore protein 16-4 chloroplastic isoform X2 [Prunus yedoensis var. nudiflora]|uniref:Outer envelope pore protein 16-4 chloroplastic isoform X2 n=1 Tax=Prunus yedoensis var. nudiflora TaxID=2094558 RepID=A0A314Y4V5_PRUYE|nr:outer envelope pore protein 16-4 chloroplastic isoform X2 [Prunus yedoensis var. nudiflora]
MEGEPYDVVPCSSVAVDSILRIGTAGAIWGLCSAPHEARKQGLAGVAQAAFVARSASSCGFQYGLVAGICTATHCGLQRYRGKSDWVNGLIAGAVAGGAIAAMTRSWTQVVPMACLVSAFKVATDYARTT